jgi:hypothetical protein
MVETHEAFSGRTLNVTQQQRTYVQQAIEFSGKITQGLFLK